MKEKRKKLQVSIIIRTYNEERKIKKCLDKLFSQTYKNFEIIIVDSGSQDRTLEIIEKFPVKIIKIKKKDFTFGKSLNLGCSESKGKYCVSLSAHAFPINNVWLEHLIKPLKNKKIAGVYGREVPKQDCNASEARRILGTFGEKEKIQTEDCFFTNSNSAFKRNLWKKTKFDEKLSTTEDHLWAKQVIKKGYAIYYEPKAKIYHSHNYSPKQLYERYKEEIYNKYKKIEKKNSFFIFYKGVMDILYSLIADWKFILKKRKKIYYLFMAIPYNATILASLITATLKK